MAAVSAKDIIQNVLKIKPEEVASINGEAIDASAPVADPVVVAPVDPAPVADAVVLDPPAPVVQPAIVDPNPTPAPVVTEPAELSDEDLMALLQKKGISATSLEELKTPKVLTPEDVAAQKVEKQNSAIKFGLEKNLFSANELSNYNVDSAKDPADIAFSLFAAQQKQLDAAITPEEIQERFAEKYGTDREEGHWLREAGKEQMEGLKDMYLDKKYGNIREVENHFDQEQTILNAVRQYKATVDNIFNTPDREFKQTFTEDNPNGGDPIVSAYSYKFSEQEINDVRSKFLTEENFSALNGGTVDVQKLNQSVELALFGLHKDKIIHSIAKSYADDKLIRVEAERKNVKPVVPDGGSAINNDAPVENPGAQAIMDGILKGKK